MSGAPDPAGAPAGRAAVVRAHVVRALQAKGLQPVVLDDLSSGMASFVPEGVPFGLTDAFATDAQKQSQWAAFLRRNRLAAPALAAVVAELRAFFVALDPWAGGRHPGHGQPQPQQTP